MPATGGKKLPGAFILGRRLVEIAEVLDRWLGPDHRYFKIRGDDGALYILRHEAETDSWELTLFSGREDTGRQ